eukprot:TRINITY_DN39176_c0_g1_i1.p1 TRINITY_DN39176_c0_g1~~TRINITY_DN39176_c0_g1_i1.p1  ORF type:complete len:240 (+),score=49.35 TRINITY_DN39176_c0_g1_i1:212-931(+)
MSGEGGGGMHGALLNIQPAELKFPFELRKQVACSLRLVNVTSEYVAFKVKTTTPKKYCVRPNTGVVPPQSSAEVTVMMQAQKEAPADLQCKDKFLVQSVTVPQGSANKENTQELFTEESGREIHNAKLRVVYVAPPPLPAPVMESPDEGVLTPSPSISEFASDSEPVGAPPPTATPPAPAPVKRQPVVEVMSSEPFPHERLHIGGASFSLLQILFIALLAFILGYFLGTPGAVPAVSPE